MALLESRKLPCELVDGVLVEKMTGFYESVFTGVFIAAAQKGRPQ